MPKSGLTLGIVALLLAPAATAFSAGSADQAALERLLDDWASAWSSNDTAKLLPLFTDDVFYEDVTFGAINKSGDDLRKFAQGAFGSGRDGRRLELKRL
jgi:ketosteroid isomerase-like protein